MTESTGKMRDWIIALTEHDFNWKRVQGLDILDEIEREIAERFVELPLDADGVPIHLGDLLFRDNGDMHYCQAIGKPSLDIMDEYFTWWRSECFHHTMPRTVEDVTRDFVNSVVTFKGSRDGIPVVGIDDGLWRDYFDAFADEIRELVGDAE